MADSHFDVMALDAGFVDPDIGLLALGKAFRGELVPTETDLIIAASEPTHGEADRSAVATP